jgi:uncharacterized OsmC-like protein
MHYTLHYNGDLSCDAVHLSSGTQILTDAPPDNQGLGRSFSPTDLLSTSLAACMMTIMGIKARDMGIDLTGSRAEVTKTMGGPPRRVAEVGVRLIMKGVPDDGRTRPLLEAVAHACPVAKSLHPDVRQAVSFEYVD